MPLNLEELKALLQILEERAITEFELEEENLKLRVRKGSAAQTTPVVHAVPPPVAVLPAAGPLAVTTISQAPALAEAAGADLALALVKSPIVGTFYRSPDPASPPFVKEGDPIRVGQVLCIIEAMKLMNEIEAEVAGELVKIHKESGQPVQYGETLFSVRLAP